MPSTTSSPDPWDAVSKPWQGMLDSRKPLLQIGVALEQIVLTGDKDLAAGAARVLDQAVRALYQLLANQGTGASSDNATTVIPQPHGGQEGVNQG